MEVSVVYHFNVLIDCSSFDETKDDGGDFSSVLVTLISPKEEILKKLKKKTKQFIIETKAVALLGKQKIVKKPSFVDHVVT